MTTKHTQQNIKPNKTGATINHITTTNIKQNHIKHIMLIMIIYITGIQPKQNNNKTTTTIQTQQNTKQTNVQSII